MSNFVSNYVNNIIQSLIKTAELASEYGENDSSKIEFFQNSIIDLLSIKMDNALTDKALRISKQENTVNNFESVYNKVLRSLKNKKKSVKLTNEYKNAMSEIREIIGCSASGVHEEENFEEEELCIDNVVSDLDPITKQPMQNPVRNKICNHHYERSSIEESLKVNQRFRCPVAGCGNNKYICLEDLIEDRAYLRNLQRQREKNLMD